MSGTLHAGKRCEVAYVGLEAGALTQPGRLRTA
jgi:hypothetical protein